MSGPRMGVPQMNGNKRPVPKAPSMEIENPTSARHEDIIKYIYESWTQVEMDRGTNSVRYYQERENHQLKDFRPFDLDAYWGRRMHQMQVNVQQHS